ncbi:Rieske (2Fe-2S) protein [Streptomyces sp. NPDC005899]|uniref:Rieske (2Fe-2S) protein n=1 Tax=Streptomyces sp. NPDC005899 TaxID=3155716 RepID=UPI0033C6CC33
MSTSQEGRVRLGRRAVVAAVGAAGAAAALAACGGSKEQDGARTVRPAEGGGGGAVLARTADIPEGGGTVFGDRGVVVTQPKAGIFKAFSSTCTHQGCAVKEVTGNTINCPCHGSTFDAATGEVTGGPATQALPGKSIQVEGDSITLA